MSFPPPVNGQVIRYSYLWLREHQAGHEEGVKDRPCAVVLVTREQAGAQVVTVLPITHRSPEASHVGLSVEIPAATKRRLGLDSERSWIVLTEANRFVWPGPDLRPASSGDPASVIYGLLPATLFERVRTAFLQLLKSGKAEAVQRTE